MKPRHPHGFQHHQDWLHLRPGQQRFNGNANFSTKSGRGTCKLTVTNISKPGHNFDPANRVLSKSITK